jgi:hypothetical protein
MKIGKIIESTKSITSKEVENRLCLNCNCLINIRYQLVLNKLNKAKAVNFILIYEVLTRVIHSKQLFMLKF